MDLRLDPVDSLVERHLPLVYSAARRYAGSGEPLEDLVQAGSVGLVAAARRFDPARGIPFPAFAAPTGEGELRRHLRDRAAPIRIPRKQQERAAAPPRTAQGAPHHPGPAAPPAQTPGAARVRL